MKNNPHANRREGQFCSVRTLHTHSEWRTYTVEGVLQGGDVLERVLILLDVDRTVGGGPAVGGGGGVAVGGTFERPLFGGRGRGREREALQPCAMALQGDLRGGDTK